MSETVTEKLRDIILYQNINHVSILDQISQLGKTVTVDSIHVNAQISALKYSIDLMMESMDEIKNSQKTIVSALAKLDIKNSRPDPILKLPLPSEPVEKIFKVDKKNVRKCSGTIFKLNDTLQISSCPVDLCFD